MAKHLLFLILVFGSGYFYWNTRPISHGPGVLAPDEPTQANAFGLKAFSHDQFQIEPLAKYQIQARTLSKKRYRGNIMAELSPYDLVVGWGPMSDSRNLDYILIKQSNRDFKWEMTRPPIPEKEMKRYSSNMHLIPSNQKIHDKLKDIREGHIIKMQGYLVKATTDSGWTLQSSLSRKDDSSELFWIKEIEIIDL